jgi:hypothetical protein
MTTGEIDADWLTAALRTRVPGVTVNNATIVDINHGTCTKVRVQLDMDDAGLAAGVPERVIVKGGFEPHSREMFMMHELEGRFYRDIQPDVELHTPRCFYADFDPENRQGIVILDDLIRRNAYICSALEPQSFEQLKRRMSSFARFHASSWNSPEFRPGGKWANVMGALEGHCAHLEQFGMLEPDTWKGWVSLPRGVATSWRFHDAEWAQMAIKAMVNLAEQQPRSLMHGDTHPGNLFEEADGTPGFYDPSAVCGPPLLEISYHLIATVDMVDRRDWERPLIEHYLSELNELGVDAPSIDEAMDVYATFSAYGYIVFIINATVFQLETVNTAYTARFNAAMLDHDVTTRLRRFA